MTSRFWPLATLIFGALTIGTMLGFSLLPEVQAAFPDGDFAAAMNAFQRSATPADMAAVFGAPPRGEVVAAMHAANVWDLWAFIPTYAPFYFAGVAAVAGGVRARLAWPALALIVIGAAADVVETILQLRMTADIAHADALLPVLPWFCVKYGALVLAGLGVSAIALRGARRRPVLAALGVTPALFVAGSLALGRAPLMVLALDLLLVGLLVSAVLELLRERQSSTST